MYILGINAYHADAAACIYKDSQLIAASEEERFRRIKHWAGFPLEAINFCLKEAEISLDLVDHIAVSRDPKANLSRKIMMALKNKLSLKNMIDRAQNLNKAASITEELGKHFNISEHLLNERLTYVEHHRSHLASAYFASPFKEAALLSIDGFGDFTSTMTATGLDNKIKVLNSVRYPHSAGLFYTTLTQFLGFPHYGDEYKVMGLAPYGDPVYVTQLMEVIRFKNNGLFELNLEYFNHHRKGVQMTWNKGTPHIETLYTTALSELFGQPREPDGILTDHHRNLAASVQCVAEKLIFHILNHLQEQTGLKNICIAGGVAQNSVANGKVTKNTGFKALYIPPSGHDSGTSLGAALWVNHQILGKQNRAAQNHAYFGSRFNNTQIESLLLEKRIPFRTLTGDALFNEVSNCIIGGGVVGWFQGRAEFGPRALGNRSILADPRRQDAKNLLNDKIKRREPFRPFAPSILKEHVSEYFEIVDEAPFMEKVFHIRACKQPLIPAVCHVDGTGRLQTVDAETNPKYYGLISNFYQKTGIPILLNTSFNENEPIVNSPQEALDCFLRTRMDMLIMEDIIVKRQPND